jgi:hypothetical protein
MYNEATGTNGPMLYKTQLLGLYNTDPALITPWLQQVTADSIYLDGDYALTDGYIGMLQSGMQTFGDDAAIMEAGSLGIDKSMAGRHVRGLLLVGRCDGLVTTLSGGTGGLATLGYTNDPINYINSLVAVRGRPS